MIICPWTCSWGTPGRLLPQASHFPCLPCLKFHSCLLPKLPFPPIPIALLSIPPIPNPPISIPTVPITPSQIPPPPPLPCSPRPHHLPRYFSISCVAGLGGPFSLFVRMLIFFGITLGARCGRYTHIARLSVAPGHATAGLRAGH